MVAKSEQRIISSNAKKAYKNDAMENTQVYKWFSHFKIMEWGYDDKTRSGRHLHPETDGNVRQL